MGCDIHIYAEKRVDGKWVTADKWEPSEYDDGSMCVPFDEQLCPGRNYQLFAILADVRNGYGFGGVDTGDALVPIDALRGLPDDVSTEVKTESDGWGGDGHSHSFFTVQELLEYDWTQIATLRGWVTAKAYETWQRCISFRPAPPSSCGGVSGLSIRHVTESEMRELIKGGVEQSSEDLRSTYCKIHWKISYSQQCPEFWSETIPTLLQIGKPEDVRIVFWFDN